MFPKKKIAFCLIGHDHLPAKFQPNRPSGSHDICVTESLTHSRTHSLTHSLKDKPEFIGRADCVFDQKTENMYS